MVRRKVRRKSASADAARARELLRIGRLSPLERIAKALALGRRGRLWREMSAAGPGGGA